MEIKELRIGNYVICSDNKIHKISNFVDGKVWFEKSINNKGDNFWLSSNLNAINPVKVTEETLLQLGFNKEYKKGYIGIDVNHTDFVLTKRYEYIRN